MKLGDYGVKFTITGKEPSFSVQVWIDHQGFTIVDDRPLSEARWYRRNARIAFKRLITNVKNGTNRQRQTAD